jgi:hypothetical protein
MTYDRLVACVITLASLAELATGCNESSGVDTSQSPERAAQSGLEASPADSQQSRLDRPKDAAAPEVVRDIAETDRSSPAASEERTLASEAVSDPDADTPTLPDLNGAEAAIVEPHLAGPPKPMEAPEGAVRAHPDHEVWIDPARRALVVHGFICFREGPLEMFACPHQTKEHESIVAVYSSAQAVHAALLGLGAEKGEPVRFLPEFRPPTGTEIDVHVEWEDENGELHSARAQEWVRDARTQQAMGHPWVFAGSGFWRDAEGREHYQAEAGDFICVSNFSSATLDIPVESTQANEGLAFEAFTERIPPLFTPVRLILTPKLDPQPEAGDATIETKRPPL